MNVKRISLAISLADTLHFGRAAEQANIAQSSLSAQIARLEDELGFRIFERTSRNVVLTKAGCLFIDHAKRIIGAMEASIQECQELALRNRDVLRVGFFGESSAELEHRIFSLFRLANPNIQLVFSELNMANQVQSLISEKVDAAFLRLPIDDERLECIPLLEEPRVAAVPCNHEMAEAAQLHVSDLEGKPFAVACDAAPIEWARFWSLGHTGDHTHGFPKVASIPESLATIAYGNAFDTFPLRTTRFFQHPGVRYVPLVDASHSTLALVSRRDSSRSVRLLQRCVAALASEATDSGGMIGAAQRA